MNRLIRFLDRLSPCSCRRELAEARREIQDLHDDLRAAVHLQSQFQAQADNANRALRELLAFALGQQLPPDLRVDPDAVVRNVIAQWLFRGDPGCDSSGEQS